MTLFLPFEIGGKGFARRTDGSLIGENQEDKGEARASARKDELYQPGYNHFIPSHGPQLGDVLGSWASMVGTGEWEVDGEGVTGGIEKWRDADSEECYWRYQLMPKW